EILTYSLSRAGFKIDGFHDLEELQVSSLLLSPQLILVGNTHPSENQIDICKQLRQTPEFADAVLICMTTSKEQCEAQSSQKDAVDGCVLTPILPKDLVKQINEVLTAKLLLANS
ncbi:MAG: hypothetical protein AAFR59_00285, partial [Bacteroidota bacterium]